MNKTIITAKMAEPSLHLQELRRVFIPLYSGGEKARVLNYGISCAIDSIKRGGEAAIIPEMIYMQCLNENDNSEMSKASMASAEWLKCSEGVVIYIDRGISLSMQNIYMMSLKNKKEIEFRSIDGGSAQRDMENSLNSGKSNVSLMIEMFEAINAAKRSNYTRGVESGDFCGNWSAHLNEKMVLTGNDCIAEKMMIREAVLKNNEAAISIDLMLGNHKEERSALLDRAVSSWGLAGAEQVKLSFEPEDNDGGRLVSINRFGYDTRMISEINKNNYATFGV